MNTKPEDWLKCVEIGVAIVNGVGNGRNWGHHEPRKNDEGEVDLNKPEKWVGMTPKEHAQAVVDIADIVYFAQMTLEDRWKTRDA